MKPYYETELGKLYHGDCLEIMPNIELFDVMLTDPVWPNSPAGMFLGVEDPYELFQQAIEKIRYRSDLKRIIVVMRNDSDPRFLTLIPLQLKFFRTIQLPYVMPGYIGRKLGGDELAYWFGGPIKSGKGRRVIPGRAPPAQPSDRPQNGHPCSRAQSHFNWLLNWVSDENETILDPFSGSGTTMVSCEKLNRKWVGIEIEEKYCEIAARRIELERKQLKLFK